MGYSRFDVVVRRFEEAYPNSRKVYVDGPQGVRVPMREIALGGGEPPLRVYDTSGPHAVDVRAGLPKLRQPWIDARRGGPVSHNSTMQGAAS